MFGTIFDSFNLVIFPFQFHRRVRKKTMNYFFTTIKDSPLRYEATCTGHTLGFHGASVHRNKYLFQSDRQLRNIS